MTYNDDNRLTSIAYGGVTDTFTYNYQGLRTRAYLNGTYYRYLYNGERVLQELEDDGDVTATYTLENGSYYGALQAIKRTSLAARYPLYDEIGSARGLADSSGNVTDTYDMDTFGRPISTTGSTPNPYQYGAAWGYTTEGSGLQQLGARFYWPEVGRFIQQDPIGDGMNWYAYVGNNPVSRIDPEGLDWLDDASNYSAGFGDWISFGATSWARQQLGYNDAINSCSTAYNAGRWTGVGYDVVGLAIGVTEVKAAVGVAKATTVAKAATHGKTLTGMELTAQTIRELTKGRIGLDIGNASRPVGKSRLLKAGVPKEIAKTNPKVPHLNIRGIHVIINRHNFYKPWKWFVR